MGSVVATAGLLFGGAGAGMAVARLVAPGSELAQMIGFLVLPLALVTGFQLWLGAAIVLLLPSMVRAIRRDERPVVSPAERNAVPPGHSVFVATGTGWGVLAGVGIGLVPSAGSFVAAAGASWRVRGERWNAVEHHRRAESMAQRDWRHAEW